MAKARNKWTRFLETITNREAAISGIVCMAAAFATYLGPFSYSFRRKMLTNYWPKCLRERGVALLLDDSPDVLMATNSEQKLVEKEPEVG